MGIKLPLGIDSFEKLITSESYYIDKTSFIGELLNETFEVNLITRPRRFGKTLTLSMLKDFFDISKDSKKHFEGLAISNDINICENWMNKWPVLFLTLKNVEGNDFESALEMFTIFISGLCKQYSFLEKSMLVDKDDIKIFKQLKSQTAKIGNLKDSLFILTHMMKMHYNKPVILLIDEYDVPLSNASENGYYKQMLDIIRIFLGKALKTNENLKLAVITGCLPIVKESNVSAIAETSEKRCKRFFQSSLLRDDLSTGTNNFITNSIISDRFDECIGFTENDVQKILKDTKFESHAL